MGGEWQQMTIADIADVYDGPHATPQKTESGPFFLGISDLSSGRLDLRESEHLSEEDYVRWTRRVAPQAGDVVFSYETRLGEAAIVPDGLRCCLGRRMGLLRVKRDRADPRFVLYTWLSPAFQEVIRQRTVPGSTVDRIPIIGLPDFPLRIPSLDEQRAIARILGTLDDKIELNRRMNETLEAMARALFESWFVDFEPVRAKLALSKVEEAEGRPSLRSGHATPGLPRQIADLFPESFEDSELGDIPKGWGTGNLGDAATHPRRGVNPNDMEPSTPYIALEHMPRGSIAISKWGLADGLASSKLQFKTGEILFGKLRPYFHKVGVAPVDGLCSTDIVVVTPRAEMFFGFVLGHVSSDAFVEYTSAGSTGTKMPRTSWDQMASYPVAMPPERVAQAFTNEIRPAVDRIIASVHESRTIGALRDTLLPKLISGELRVADAEAFLKERQV